MAHFSDGLHLELCTGINCFIMRDRSQMAKKPGGRGWYCQKCFENLFGKWPHPVDTTE